MNDPAAPQANSPAPEVDTASGATAPLANAENASTIVVGSGPAGVRFCHELLKQAPLSRVTLLGDEAVAPYNRVQLSSLLAGKISHSDIVNPLPDLAQHPNFSFQIARIESIDRENQAIVDSFGVRYDYSKLVLALGSSAHEPNIPGVAMQGVYTFRNMKDTEYLYSRTTRSRHIVVVGGGLLGIEAAKALQRGNTKVTLVQQANRLMNRQLDDTAANLLQQKIEDHGVQVITNSGVRAVLGEHRVEGVRLYNKEEVECDTVLLCTGIKPNIKLALDAKIKVATGIVVDDNLQTSAENIFAIGECCEHRGKTYGLVTPGLEQASAAANVILAQLDNRDLENISYHGSFAVTRLKVLDENVCSMGDVNELNFRARQHEWVYHSRKQAIYRKIITHKGKLIGVLGVGDWKELARAQEAWQNQRTVYPWQIARFLISGQLWSADYDVSTWPETAIVCQCNNVSQGEIQLAINKGCTSLKQIRDCTRASSTCGSCKPLVESMLGQEVSQEKETASKWLLACSVIAIIIAAFLAMSPALQVSESVQSKTLFEGIWNDKTWKQITGFTLLGLSLIGLLMSLRKRLKWAFIQKLGDYAWWRLSHLILGVSCALILFFHTGMHFGVNLNFLLMTSFVSTLVLGGLTGAVVSLSHHLSPHTARNLKRFWTWAHTLVVWPLPALLSIHILTVYYF